MRKAEGMRFSLFLHMERYDAAKPHRELLAELVELVQLAESGGFCAAWIGEHYGMEYTIGPNPLAYLAYLAPQTHTIRLGTGNIVAPFWHPVKLASEAALIDLMSHGRLDFGIARGAYQFEFDRICDGMPSPEGGKHLREMLPVLKALWTGDYAHDGELWRFPATTSVPHPTQAPHPPIWVAARDPATHDWAVGLGCNVQVTPLAKDDAEVDALVAKFDAACANHPEVARPDLMLLRHAYVVGSAGEKRAAAEAIRRFYAYFEGWFKNAPGSIANGFCGPLPEDEMAQKPDYAIDRVLNNQVIGTPDEVIARLRRYADQGVDEFSIWLDNSTGFGAKKAMIELFIREVMPAFAPAAATRT